MSGIYHDMAGLPVSALVVYRVLYRNRALDCDATLRRCVSLHRADLRALLGTMAGLGLWASFFLKSAFALVGFSAYLIATEDSSAGRSRR